MAKSLSPDYAYNSDSEDEIQEGKEKEQTLASDISLTGDDI